jgi:membrane protein
MRFVDSIRARAAALPRRWPWLRLVLDVKDRFDEIHGGYLASAITLSTFLSLFPLLLVITAVVGFVTANNSNVVDEIISNLGLTGDAATAVRDAMDAARQSRRAASIVGLVGLLWSGLGLVAAIQYAFDAVWQVKGRGIKDKLYGLLWLAGAGLLFVASFALTALLAYVPFLAPLNILVGLGIGTGLFLWSQRVLANRDVGWRPLLPGAVLGAVGFEILKAIGSFLVPRLVASSSALYGSIGTVFAILAWLFFFGRLLVLSATVNVVLWERRHGTTTVEVEVPNLPGADPSVGTRAGEAGPSDEPAPPAETAATPG